MLTCYRGQTAHSGLKLIKQPVSVQYLFIPILELKKAEGCTGNSPAWKSLVFQAVTPGLVHRLVSASFHGLELIGSYVMKGH